MKKVIRLTESDLYKIVNRVLREQEKDQSGQELPGEDAYQKSVQAQKEMDDTIINNFVNQPSMVNYGGKTYYYKINQVKIPKINESRTIGLMGNQIKPTGGGKFTDVKIGSNNRPPYFITYYTCKWFKQPEGEKKPLPTLDYKGRIEFLNDRAQDDSSDTATIYQDTVNFIEENWCKKMPQLDSSNEFGLV